jgi:hypothetical protein
VRTVDDLREALHYAAASAPPDPGAIIARARRQRATRRTIVATSTAAVLGVAVALIAARPPSLTPAPYTTDAGPPSLAGAAPDPALVAAASSVDAAIEAPTKFDPLTRTLHLGWIPSGLREQTASTSTTEQMYGAKDETWRDGGGDRGLVVTVLARGRPLSDFTSGALGLPMDAVARPTDPVNGHRAWCLSDPRVPGSCPALRWQYAEGAWARVSYAGSAGPTPERAAAVARRVAESMSLSAGEPVRMPFRIDGPLARMRVAGTTVHVQKPGTTGRLGERWSASLDLVDRDSDLTGGDGPRYLDIGALFKQGDPSGRIERDNPPNTTVAGHPAWLQADGRALVVWGVSDTRTSVEYTNRPGSARDAFGHVRLLRHPDDPADWIPVR